MQRPQQSGRERERPGVGGEARAAPSVRRTRPKRTSRREQMDQEIERVVAPRIRSPHGVVEREVRD